MEQSVNVDGRWFLAAVPDEAVAARIYRLARTLKRAHNFSGKPIASDRLHISLFFLGGLPDHIVRMACEALTGVRMQPFDVSFDRVVSFRGKPGSRPFVLVGGEGPSQLKSFRQMLGDALTRRGLRREANTNFTPHVTLLYDARHAEEYPIEPISWTVHEFVLIRSKNGHQHVARWPLRS
jgi:RNA 2',3'-cyclic 3'-phosphodiesterase